MVVGADTNEKVVILNLGNDQGVATSRRSTKRSQSPIFRVEEYKTAPLVSFCISHKNRTHQIKETLVRNLQDNQIDRNKIEFVFVDFGSEEDVAAWVIDTFPNELNSGYLKFFRCNELDKWHAPKAKNTTHRVSMGKILVNLDGDNFTGYRGGMHVFNAFMSSKYDVCFWQYSGDSQDGSFGRIAATRDAFFSIGGYNEDFLEMGFQDRDLVNRLEIIGVQVLLDPDKRYNQALINDKYTPHEMQYEVMRRFNRRLAGRLIRTDSTLANYGQMGFSHVERLMFNLNERTADYVAV